MRGADIVDAVMTPWCAKHFGQAEGTPFTTGRWLKELDIEEERNVVEQIIAGETVTKETDEKVRQHCTRQKPDGWSQTVPCGLKLTTKQIRHYPTGGAPEYPEA